MRRAMEWSRGQKCLKNNIEHAGTVEVTVFPSRDGPVHSLNHKIKILYSPSQVYILIKKRERESDREREKRKLSVKQLTHTIH